MRDVPLMMNEGAVRAPMLPRKLAIEDRNCVHVCFSAGGASASESGTSGVLSLLDMLAVRAMAAAMKRGCAWKGTVGR